MTFSLILFPEVLIYKNSIHDIKEGQGRARESQPFAITLWSYSSFLCQVKTLNYSDWKYILQIYITQVRTKSLPILVVWFCHFWETAGSAKPPPNWLLLLKVSFTLRFRFLWKTFQMSWKSPCYRMGKCSLGLFPGWVGLSLSSAVAVAWSCLKTILSSLLLLCKYSLFSVSPWRSQSTYCPPQTKDGCPCNSHWILQDRFFQFCCLISCTPVVMDISESTNAGKLSAQMRFVFLANTIN